MADASRFYYSPGVSRSDNFRGLGPGHHPGHITQPRPSQSHQYDPMRDAHPSNNSKRDKTRNFSQGLPAYESYRRKFPVYDRHKKDYEDAEYPHLPLSQSKRESPLFASGVPETVGWMREVNKDKEKLEEAFDEFRREVAEEEEGGCSRRTLVPIVAAAFAQMVAGFYFATTNLTLFTTVVTLVFGKADKVSLVREMFFLFSALASLSCAPVIRNFGYKKLTAGAGLLLIFSCLSSSAIIKSSSDILIIIPFSVFGGIAYGLLRTSSLVTTLDYLPKRRVLAVTLTGIGYSTGAFVGSIVFYEYMINHILGEWQNTLQIIEVTAIVAIFFGIFLKKPSTYPTQLRRLSRHAPSYVLLIIYLIGTLGMTILSVATTILPSSRKFEFSRQSLCVNPLFAMFGGQLVVALLVFCVGLCTPKGLISKALGIVAVVLLIIGVATMAHVSAYDDFWSYFFYSMSVGAGFGFNFVLVPLAMTDVVGRGNTIVGIGFLNFVQDFGGLLGNVVIGEIGKNDFILNTAMYLGGSCVLLFAVVAFICFWVFPQWPDEESILNREKSHLNGTFHNAAYRGP